MEYGDEYEDHGGGLKNLEGYQFCAKKFMGSEALLEERPRMWILRWLEFTYSRADLVVKFGFGGIERSFNPIPACDLVRRRIGGKFVFENFILESFGTFRRIRGDVKLMLKLLPMGRFAF